MWKCRDVLLHSDQFKLMFCFFFYQIIILLYALYVCLKKQNKE